MNWKEEFKKYMRPGDYQAIADATGKAERTIATFFTKRGAPWISKATTDAIRLEALKIVRQRILNGMEFLKKEKFPLRPRAKKKAA